MITKEKQVCGWERPQHLKPKVRIDHLVWLSRRHVTHSCPISRGLLPRGGEHPVTGSTQAEAELSAVRKVSKDNGTTSGNVSSIPYSQPCPFVICYSTLKTVQSLV